MKKIILIVGLISLTWAVPFNQPNFSLCAQWDPSGITASNSTVHIGKPTGIFINTRNMIYVTSEQNNFIMLFGNSIYPNDYYNNIQKPPSVFVTDNNDIYFSEGGSNAQVGKIPMNSSSKVTVKLNSNPCDGLFIDENNYLYCASAADHIVFKTLLNSSGNPIITIAGTGFSGPNAMTLNQPHGIFVDDQFNLYVADTFNDRIQLFKAGQMNGTTVARNGSISILSLKHPTSVVLDSDKILYIVDSGNHRIVRSLQNRLECLFGCARISGSMVNQLSSPTNLVFDPYGNIYVTDTGNDRVQKFLLSTNSCFTTQAIVTITTVRPILSNLSIFNCQNSSKIGIRCNISSSPCDMFVPCQNGGTCIDNSGTFVGYTCQCLPGFDGSQCQIDTRPCKQTTCWNNGTCVNISNNRMKCICTNGWTGIHCERKINYCENVTCENYAICRSLFRDFQCECISKYYTGRYCEFEENILTYRKVMSKSFAYVAIIWMSSAAAFAIISDILKYFFHIDPTSFNRRHVIINENKSNKSSVAVRFIYVNSKSF